jgi:hypothetical protein
MTTLKEHIDKIIGKHIDKRIKANTINLFKKIIEFKTIRLWTLSDGRNEFERNKNLINGKLNTVLDDKKISEALIKNSVEKLSGNKRVFILSDHSDIRKPYSTSLENLGKVRDLNGNIINGNTVLGSVILNESKTEITLSNITVFSNGDEKFVSKKELEDYENNKIEDDKRREQIKEAIENKDYINMKNTLHKHLLDQSRAMKLSNPAISICHVHDRGEDGIEYLEFIKDELKDDTVVRVKKSRNSNQYIINPKTKRKNYIKLIDVEFKNKTTYHLDKLTLKGKCYQDSKILLEWDKINLNDYDYSTVRITIFKRDGTKIYKDPMLLITTIDVKNEVSAKEIYHIYLLRAKIEGVFKFLKDVLGWEEFQVRDWESIKNIIAICFFIGGYFYEIKSELTNNETIIMICDLAKSKGKITHYFFLEGLKTLLIAFRVDLFRKERGISDEFFKEMQSYAGIGVDF